MASNTPNLKISLVVSNMASAGVVRAFLLAQALKTLQFKVEIVGLSSSNNLYTIPHFEVPISYIISDRYPKFFISAIKSIKRIDGDIIYAMKPRPTSFGLSLLKKLITRRPVILDIDDWELSWHGGDRESYLPSLKQPTKRRGLRHPDHPFYVKWMEDLVSYADAVTIHTDFLKERFGGVYLPNGKDTLLFDPCHYEPEASRKYYKLSEYRVLMFPGAPRPHKGLEDVLMALDQLNETDLRLVIVGGSPYDDYDEKLIQQWGRWIIKLPKYPIEEMPKIVAAAHIVVVPQRDNCIARSQFPLKLTDGMAMAKPILATRVGDIPQILGDTGYLVEPSSPKQIAEKIQWIFQHLEETKERGMKARERCVNYYSIDAMAAILSDVIARL